MFLLANHNARIRKQNNQVQIMLIAEKLGNAARKVWMVADCGNCPHFLSICIKLSRQKLYFTMNPYHKLR